MGPEPDGRGISSNSIEYLRSILISSLPHENIGEQDRKRAANLKRVTFDAKLGGEPLILTGDRSRGSRAPFCWEKAVNSSNSSGVSR